MTATARTRPPPCEGPGLRRTSAREVPVPDGATADQRPAILALVDELAVLAADLWFAGKLDQFPLEEEPADAEDE